MNEDAPFSLNKITGRAAVRPLLESLGQSERGVALALYINNDLELVGTRRVGFGAVRDVRFRLTTIVRYGKELGAEGFIIAHYLPPGDPEPSLDAVNATNDLRRQTAELDLPLLDHLIITDEKMISVGGLHGRAVRLR